MLGHRPVERIFYPESEMARRHGAEAPEPTPEPRVAYSDVPSWEEIGTVQWPVR
jgi:hypothetical protein